MALLGFNDRRERQPVPPAELRSHASLVEHLSSQHGGAPLSTTYAELRAQHEAQHQSDLAIQAVPHTHSR
jgi:hypothetical protein